MAKNKPFNHEENQILIAEWQEAYRAFNERPAPNVSYDLGWFIIEGGGRYRRKTLTDMAAELRRRVREGSGPIEDPILD